MFIAAAAAKPLPSCLTLCDPIDGSPPGFPIPGILQERTLEWIAISFPNAWKWKVKGKSLSHVRLCDPVNRSMPGLPVHHQLPEFTQTHVHRVSDAIQPSHPLGKYIPKYFILFVAMVNGIVSLISLSVFSLLVYRNVRDFSVLILYPATLLCWFDFSTFVSWWVWLMVCQFYLSSQRTGFWLCWFLLWSLLFLLNLFLP